MATNTQTEVTATQKEPERERNIFTFKVTQLIWLFLGILEGLLALRFILKLIAANPNSPITVFFNGLTGFLLMPFAGLTAAPRPVAWCLKSRP
jgi:hypothetical protein